MKKFLFVLFFSIGIFSKYDSVLDEFYKSKDIYQYLYQKEEKCKDIKVEDDLSSIRGIKSNYRFNFKSNLTIKKNNLELTIRFDDEKIIFIIDKEIILRREYSKISKRECGIEKLIYVSKEKNGILLFTIIEKEPFNGLVNFVYISEQNFIYNETYNLK